MSRVALVSVGVPNIGQNPANCPSVSAAGKGDKDILSLYEHVLMGDGRRDAPLTTPCNHLVFLVPSIYGTYTIWTDT